MQPKRSSAAPTAWRACASSVTSSARGSRASCAPKRFSTEAASRDVATTASPWASAASAMRAPMPREAPVIIQTREYEEWVVVAVVEVMTGP